jgi:nitrogen fixation/metabolism regulation signal transduction histidine kinase
MRYAIFRTQILIRLLLIVATGLGVVYVLFQTHFWLVSFWLGLLMVILFVELLRYIERSHREMENLVIAIRQGDFSSSYHRRPAARGHMLSEAFNQLVSTFQALRQEKEGNHQYLQNIVEQVSVALLCVDEKGKIELINRAAKELFQLPFLKKLEDLQQIDEELFARLSEMEAGDRTLIRVIVRQQLLQLSVQATEFKMQGRQFKLLSMQDFRSELEEQEVSSWQKLIRVLTHEIMNSVIPISNLTAISHQMLISEKDGKPKLNTLEEEEVEDLHGSLLTIEERTQGLVSFVKAYKSLTQISQPQFRVVAVEELFRRLKTLFKPRLLEKKIAWQQKVLPENLSIKADFELLEQVLINLLNNALDAVEGSAQPEIRLEAFVSERNQRIIQISDNGSGIEEEVMEQIFIPFFTTKASGSGIGLSLSRQIMRLHKGNISVQSEKGRGTTFTLSF